MWSPRQNSRSSAPRSSEKFVEALDESLQRVQDRLRQLVDEGELIPVTQKRRFQHFEWLVRMQVLGESVKDVADRISLSETKAIDVNTVASGADSVAKFIGMQRRKPPRGRPRGARKNTE